MNRLLLRAVSWVVVTAGALYGGSAGVAKDEPAFVRITPAEVQWREPVIVQIIGEGPAQTIPVDAKQPMWRMVSM
jgi:hypothetical protein